MEQEVPGVEEGRPVSRQHRHAVWTRNKRASSSMAAVEIERRNKMQVAP